MKLDMQLKEFYEVKVEDAIFRVTPLDLFSLQNIQSKYETKGKIPKDREGDYNAEILERAIIGWENIEDQNGKVPFSKEKIRPVITVIAQLYPEAMEKLLKAATGLIVKVEDEKKKSKNT